MNQASQPTVRQVVPGLYVQVPFTPEAAAFLLNSGYWRAPPSSQFGVAPGIPAQSGGDPVNLQGSGVPVAGRHYPGPSNVGTGVGLLNSLTSPPGYHSPQDQLGAKAGHPVHPGAPSVIETAAAVPTVQTGFQVQHDRSLPMLLSKLGKTPAISDAATTSLNRPLDRANKDQIEEMMEGCEVYTAAAVASFPSSAPQEGEVHAAAAAGQGFCGTAEEVANPGVQPAAATNPVKRGRGRPRKNQVGQTIAEGGDRGAAAAAVQKPSNAKPLNHQGSCNNAPRRGRRPRTSSGAGPGTVESGADKQGSGAIAYAGEAEAVTAGRKKVVTRRSGTQNSNPGTLERPIAAWQQNGEIRRRKGMSGSEPVAKRLCPVQELQEQEPVGLSDEEGSLRSQLASYRERLEMVTEELDRTQLLAAEKYYLETKIRVLSRAQERRVQGHEREVPAGAHEHLKAFSLVI